MGKLIVIDVIRIPCFKKRSVPQHFWRRSKEKKLGCNSDVLWPVPPHVGPLFLGSHVSIPEQEHDLEGDHEESYLFNIMCQ
jgi:hypothetical protein